MSSFIASLEELTIPNDKLKEMLAEIYFKIHSFEIKYQ